jgi:hypothetical protein
VLSSDEFAAWETHTGDERTRAFLRVWTAKEAYLKMLGVGLTQRLRDVDAHGAQTWGDWPPGCVTSVIDATPAAGFEARPAGLP